MIKRTQTKQVKIGNVVIGHSNNIVIQSMTNTKTADADKTIKQINELVDAGAQLVRIAILDTNDLVNLKKIVKSAKCPLIADIHYDYKLGIKALECGVKGIRINPGNIGGLNNFKKVIEVAKKYHAVIRIGINAGSLHKKQQTNKEIIKIMKQYVSFANKNHFDNLVLSVKCSDPIQTAKINQLLAQNFKYPLHIGVTEAGNIETALIRSTIGLQPIINKGIGDTIRISITGNPVDEVRIAKLLLNECGVHQNLTKVISCPTCGRTANGFVELYNELTKYINAHPIKKAKVAIMGCYVNGIKESENSDFGVFGSNDKFVIIFNGKTIGSFNLKETIKKFIECYRKIK